jgi:hypothetical protein
MYIYGGFFGLNFFGKFFKKSLNFQQKICTKKKAEISHVLMLKTSSHK